MYEEFIKSCKLNALDSFICAKHEFEKEEYESAFMIAYSSALKAAEAISLSNKYIASSRRDLVRKYKILSELNDISKGEIRREDAEFSLRLAERFLKNLIDDLILIDQR